MFRKVTVLGTLAGVGFLLGGMSGAIADETQMEGMGKPTPPQPSQFQPIEQPFASKVAVTLGGLSLIGLELWWFLLSKPKSRQATAKGEGQ